MAIVSGPDPVKTVFHDCWEIYPRGQLKYNVLKPLFGDSMSQSERSDWQWQRRTIAPLFRPRDLDQYVPAMQSVALDTVHKWRQSSRDDYRPIEKDMLHAAFWVVAKSVLAGAPASLLTEIEKGYDDYIANMNWWIVYAMIGLPGWFPRPGGRIMRRHERRVRESVSSLVRSRREFSQSETDLITKLLRASDPETGRELSNDLVVDNVVSFVVAGYEAMTFALTWTLYLISRHPEWERAILDEVESVAGQDQITTDHAERLVVLQQVINESLRLYPPSPALARDVRTDVELDGVRIQKGTRLFVSVYALHRHERLWADPQNFDPTRFSSAVSQDRSRSQFIPFGIGPRICIGMTYAMLELTILLATFLRACRFTLPEGFEPTPIGRSFLIPGEGMPMKVTPRHRD